MHWHMIWFHFIGFSCKYSEFLTDLVLIEFKNFLEINIKCWKSTRWRFSVKILAFATWQMGNCLESTTFGKPLTLSLVIGPGSITRVSRPPFCNSLLGCTHYRGVPMIGPCSDHRSVYLYMDYLLDQNCGIKSVVKWGFTVNL